MTQALRRILGIRWYDKVSNAEVNERTKLPCYNADRRHSLFGHICHLPENTPASQALQLSIEAHTGSSTEKLAAKSGRRHWPICWCCPDSGPGSFDVEDATTLSWSSAAVSEWVSEWVNAAERQHSNICCNFWHRKTFYYSDRNTVCLKDVSFMFVAA